MAALGDDAGVAAEAAFFRPKGEELIDKFLHPKMSGESLPAAARFIHDADVCSMAPGALTAAHAAAPGPEGAEPVWYFFSPVHYYCVTRHVTVARHVRGGVGKWSTFRVEHLKKEVDRCGGGWYRFLFRYTDHETGQIWDPPEWLMVEHGLTKEEAGQQQLVLCKVFRAPPPKPYRPSRSFIAPPKPSRPTRSRRAGPNQQTA